MPTAGDYHNILREQDQNATEEPSATLAYSPASSMLPGAITDGTTASCVLTAPHIPG